MATRIDYVAMSQVIRRTPMPNSVRQELARRAADAFTVTSTAFRPDTFVREATRPARAGEPPTIDTAAPSGAMLAALQACDVAAGTPEHVHALQAALDLSLTRWPGHLAAEAVSHPNG